MTPTHKKKSGPLRENKKVTLKTVAKHLGLAAGTVSAALNNSPAARSIPEHTKKRIFAAAQELNYRPDFFARTLRMRRTFTIGVIAEEIGDAYGSQVISGIEKYLAAEKLFFSDRGAPARSEAVANVFADAGGTRSRRINYRGHIDSGGAFAADCRSRGTPADRGCDEYCVGPQTRGPVGAGTSEGIGA